MTVLGEQIDLTEQALPGGYNRALTDRWTEHESHREQDRLWDSDARFRVVPAGRRSGKTEIAKRFLILEAIFFDRFPDGRFICAAPTTLQAKRIFWNDLKLMVPGWALIYRDDIVKSSSESELEIRLWNGAVIQVLGMDQPARVEGPPVDGIILDEYGNCKPEVWPENVRPSLSTRGRPGWAWLIGVPEGRNHYYDLARKAQENDSGEWDYFHWFSAEILDPEEIEAAKRDLDELTYQQEYEGSFINFVGRAYYKFDAKIHCKYRLNYQPRKDLLFLFDFNVDPGVAVIAQEYDEGVICKGSPAFTGIIGEVWVPQNSNTPVVCRKLIEDWEHHKGRIIIDGDPSGGNRGTAKIDGSDWDLIHAELKKAFAGRIIDRVRKGQPRERARVNAVNSRLMSANETVRLRVDRRKAPHVVTDFEGVRILEGSAGEIDKSAKSDKKLTHVSDAIGYYIERCYPTTKRITQVEAY